jgi:hypothetical protein
MNRCTAPLEVRYLLKKARYVPLADLPRYAMGFTSNRLHRLISRDRRLAIWGPRFEGLQAMLAEERSLAEVCAAQWARCVSKAQKDLATIEPSRVIRVHYEQFVTQPAAELQRILDRLGIDAPEPEQRLAAGRVSDRSIGKWRQALDDQTLAQFAHIVDPQLIELGYAPIGDVLRPTVAA